MRFGCLLLLLTALAATAAAAEAVERINVVLIISDDQGWEDFGFMGHPVVRTPRLDRLAEQSACFPRGYVPTALCRASLASLLTGLYPQQHKLCCNDPPEGIPREAMQQLIRRVPTLPRLLQTAGYASLQTGKNWEGHFRQSGFTHGMTTHGRHGEEGLAIGRQTMQPVLDFIDAHRQQPFFVWYAPMMPHEPHNPPRRLLEQYAAAGRPPKLAAYYAMCQWFDETCGTLLDHLDRRALAERTLVALVADNGWIQETGPAKTTRGSFAPRSKLSPYDGGVRTPILLRLPGTITPGRRAEVVSSLDLAATILAACRVEPPAGLPGANLLDVLSGRQSLADRPVLGANFLHTSVDLESPARNLTHRWIRQRQWKLIVPVEGAAAELYDVERDPREEHNRLADEPEVARRLRQALDAWWPGT